MRKAYSFVLIVCLLLTLLPTCAWAAAPCTVTVADAEAAPGDLITLPVTVQNNPGFATATWTFSYDREVLELTAIKKGELLTRGSFNRNIGAGKVLWYDASDLPGDGSVFLLTFRIRPEAVKKQTTVSVALTNGLAKNFSNEKNEAIPVTFRAGTIRLRTGQLEVTKAEIRGNEIHLTTADAPEEAVKLMTGFYAQGQLIGLSVTEQVLQPGENTIAYAPRSGADRVRLFFLDAGTHSPLTEAATLLE